MEVKKQQNQLEEHPQDDQASRQKSNLFEQENEIVINLFNINDVLAFQKHHDIQVIRGSDYQYQAYIDKKPYGSALTTMGALTFGIKIYQDGYTKK